MITDIAAQRLLQLKNDLPLFARLCLKVVDSEGKLRPLIFNKSQMKLHTAIELQLKELGMVRMVVPKGRKQGVSTYTAARYLHKAFFNSYKKVFILAHLSDATATLFGIVRVFYDNLPPELKQKLIVDNKLELEFENHSSYSVATAGSGEIGRGSTPHLFHSSESASYENQEAIEAGAFSAIALVEGTESIIESTGKGPGDLFHKYCMMGVEQIGPWRTTFLEWPLHEDNSLRLQEKDLPFLVTDEEKQLQRDFPYITIEQLHWRRVYIRQKGINIFKKEYPATLEEVFETSDGKFFDSERINKAKKETLDDKTAPYIIGVDAARDGDRTIICHRRGRRIFKIDKHEQMDEMRLAGILGNIINSDNPDKVFLDVAYAHGCIDRLRELGFGRIVQGIHNNQSPINEDLYANKRAENAFAFREWLEDDVRLPDDRDISLDLLSIPPEEPTSNGRWKLKSKVDIKKAFGKSPDIFDAICLTFSYPVRRRDGQDNLDKSKGLYYNGGGTSKKKKDFQSAVMQSFDRGEQKETNQYHRRDS